MDPARVETGAEYVLNHAAPVFARSVLHGRHEYPGSGVASETREVARHLRESWRLPVVDSAWGDGALRQNYVTFMLHTETLGRPEPSRVSLVSTASGLWRSVPMSRVEDGPLWSVTLGVPFGQVHRYLFEVDGEPIADPVNPQRVATGAGEEWSRFFTWYCTETVSFDRRELLLLTRLVRHLLPLNDDEARAYLSREGRAPGILHRHRLDVDVGVANFIDKIVAKEERHHLGTYRLTLGLIDRVLRARNPYADIDRMPEEMFVELYTDLALTDDFGAGSSLGAAGWDFARYGSPRYFFQVLRRHVWTGAFAHPKYGGNSEGMGWAYLHDRFARGGPGFAWQRSHEMPLGEAPEYRG